MFNVAAIFSKPHMNYYCTPLCASLSICKWTFCCDLQSQHLNTVHLYYWPLQHLTGVHPQAHSDATGDFFDYNQLHWTGAVSFAYHKGRVTREDWGRPGWWTWWRGDEWSSHGRQWGYVVQWTSPRGILQCIHTRDRCVHAGGNTALTYHTIHIQKYKDTWLIPRK